MDPYDRLMFEDNDHSEQFHMRVGGYVRARGPGSSHAKRDKAILVASILAAHVLVVVVLVVMTRVTAEAGPTEMVEVVDYFDIAAERADGKLEAPTEETMKAALENATAEPE